jgi:ATP-binding cassette subfamily B protein
MKLNKKRPPYIAQHDSMDCGPSCLAMITRYYGKKYSTQELREYCFLSKDGVSMLGIEDAAKKIGFDTIGVKIRVADLINKKPLPCILFWGENHFVVLSDVRKKRFSDEVIFEILDPAFGKILLTEEKFKQHWTKTDKGLALLLQPTEEFHKKEPKQKKASIVNLSLIYSFMKPHKRELFILVLGLGFSSLLTLIFPFLTQALIDVGVSNNNLNFVFIILLAQIFLFLGSLIIEVVRNWVLLFINSKINIGIISEFLMKIVKLPFKFFESKQLGDFSARIGDHRRIEEFLTSQSLITIFSSINFIVFFIVLTYYDPKIVIAYSVITFLSIIWSVYFLKKLQKVDYQRFRYLGENQQAIYELINGIVEVKLNNIEDHKIGKWQDKQIKLFNTNLKTMKLDQIQHIGYDFLNQAKNILVIFIAAREVILGNITLGTLLSISYIIGQMNTPLNQLIEFLKSWQYAKLSFERLHEVQNLKEEDSNLHKVSTADGSLFNTDIDIRNVSFQYLGPRSPFILNGVSFTIPKGKMTAIVGESGSGKTTLMKLLLKFYAPVEGDIYYGKHNAENLSAKDLRKNSGVVMQDGYIFSDTLERNIATSDAQIDYDRLERAITTANLADFVESLPQKLKTMLGSGGNGISGGQKQRILIARAVYKNPNIIFFDEATSALDAENEKIIYENLDEFFIGRTVIKIAHRLSTVKSAHQIIVLKKGQIVEIGNHEQLVKNKSNYYNLVKNQLELSA